MTPTFWCDAEGTLRYRGIRYERENFVRLRDLFSTDPSAYARELEGEVSAALARFERITIEECHESL